MYFLIYGRKEPKSDILPKKKFSLPFESYIQHFELFMKKPSSLGRYCTLKCTFYSEKERTYELNNLNDIQVPRRVRVWRNKCCRGLDDISKYTV